MKFNFSPIFGTIFEVDTDSSLVNIVQDAKNGESLKVPIVALRIFMDMVNAHNEYYKYKNRFEYGIIPPAEEKIYE